MSASLLTYLTFVFGFIQPGSPLRPTPGPPIEIATVPQPEPSAPPISPRELHARVAPAVVALVVSDPASTPSIVSGVLVTASGLALTSRRAIAEVVNGTASLAMLRAGARGRLSARDMAGAVPARLIAVSDDLDLALVQAEPAESVFYPHLPITRHRAPDGSAALAVGHAEKRGLWSGTMLPVGQMVGESAAMRWMRKLPAEPSLIGAGTPLVDALGRIVGMVIAPTPGDWRVAVDAEGLLRFLLAANAPEMRFAGVPPFRRPLPTEGTGAARGLRGAHAATGAPLAGGHAAATSAESLMPSIVKKGQFDRRFSAAQSSSAGPPGTALPGAAASVSRAIAADNAQNGVSVTLADLERHPVPTTVAVGTNDVPERGERNAPVTIVQLGDYHAPETRDAELQVRSLVEGATAPARLLWKDADPGDGADYHLAARAARAAAEQNAFWPMHDRLLSGGGAPAQALDVHHVRKLARDLGLDAQEFAAALSSDGTASAVETDAERASKLPLLCTPAFVVNGRAVDGGSIAGEALRAAVDEELARSPTRTIAAGAPVTGFAFNAAKMARAVGEVIARRSR